MDRFEEKAREIGKYFDWDDNSEQVNIVAQALREEGKIEWPSEADLLKANHKYVEANFMKHDPKGSLDHAYFHGQTDLIKWLKERLDNK